MSGSTLFSIGEALIDMIPSRAGCSFDEVPSFSPRTGGAPANGFAPCRKVRAVDTTGAGDGFIGSFL